MAQTAGDWIVQHPFRPYNGPGIEMYHYAAFFCSMATLQLGGRYWEEFYPPMAADLMANQRSNGSWRGGPSEARWGEAFTTSLAVLALAAPNQLIPIYQR
jgi:hypothetical protein